MQYFTLCSWDLLISNVFLSNNHDIDQFKLTEDIRFHYFDFDGDKVHLRNNNHYEKALKYCDKTGIFLLKLYLKLGEEMFSSDDELDPVAEEDVSINAIPDENSEKSNARNNMVFSQGYDNGVNKVYLEESGIAPHLNEKYFDSMPEKSHGPQHKDVLKRASIKLLDEIAEDVKPKPNVVKGWFKDIGSMIGIGDTHKDSIELAIIEKNVPELSNEDIILAIPGSVIKKTWRITNRQCK